MWSLLLNRFFFFFFFLSRMTCTNPSLSRPRVSILTIATRRILVNLIESSSASLFIDLRRCWFTWQIGLQFEVCIHLEKCVSLFYFGHSVPRYSLSHEHYRSILFFWRIVRMGRFKMSVKTLIICQLENWVKQNIALFQHFVTQTANLFPSSPWRLA